LTVAALVSVALVVALLCAGWSGLAASQRATVSLARLTTAQGRHQDLDMAHDATHVIVAGGALDGEHGDIAGVQRKVDELALLADGVDEVFLEQGRTACGRWGSARGGVRALTCSSRASANAWWCSAQVMRTSTTRRVRVGFNPR
jgi:hypothetical protein